MICLFLGMDSVKEDKLNLGNRNRNKVSLFSIF